MQRTLFVLTNKVVNRAVRLLDVETFRGAKLLHLTTTGRRSGKLRSVPLAYVRDGDDYVVAASNGGADWQPAWWLNLQADPRGTVVVGEQRFEVVASVVDERDRPRLWRALSDQLDTYDDYQRKVRRRIELVRLRPVDHTST